MRRPFLHRYARWLRSSTRAEEFMVAMLEPTPTSPRLEHLTSAPVDFQQPSRLQLPGTTLIGSSRQPEVWVSALSAVQDIRLPRLFYALALKRGLDILVSALVLLVAVPILLLAMALIRLESPGSPLFRQHRVGRGGSVFTILKLRTMRDAPAERPIWIRSADGTISHKVRNDPRVTRVGRFLRRTSIDELPQMLNVLRGDMSLIGPRPELIHIVQRYQHWQNARHIVRPGLTGWWQVCGRGERPMHENTELDLYYIAHLSFGLDCRIALRTIGTVVRGGGAF